MAADTQSALALELAAPLLRDALAMRQAGFASEANIDLAMRLGAGHRAGPLTAAAALADEQRDRLGLSPAAGPQDGPAGPGPSVPSRAPIDGEVAVIGTGTMAAGIAQAIAQGGGRVVLVGRDLDRATAAIGAIDERLARAVQRDRLTAAEHTAIRARLRAADDVAATATDLAIEAVVEDLAVKRTVLADLESALPPDAIIATNTSSLRVGDVAAAATHPERVLALHFFNPAPQMRLVEVVSTSRTDPAAHGAATEWAQRIGKTTVTCGDASGFIVNRLLIPFLNDAARLHEDRRLSIDAIDAAAHDELGHPMGPFALMDLIGLDVMVLALETLHAAFGEDRMAPADSLREHVDAGRLGRKTGQGFR